MFVMLFNLSLISHWIFPQSFFFFISGAKKNMMEVFRCVKNYQKQDMALAQVLSNITAMSLLTVVGSIPVAAYILSQD